MAMRNLHIPQSQFRHRRTSIAFTNSKIITFLLLLKKLKRIKFVPTLLLQAESLKCHEVEPFLLETGSSFCKKRLKQ